MADNRIKHKDTTTPSPKTPRVTSHGGTSGGNTGPDSQRHRGKKQKRSQQQRLADDLAFVDVGEDDDKRGREYGETAHGSADQRDNARDELDHTARMGEMMTMIQGLRDQIAALQSNQQSPHHDKGEGDAMSTDDKATDTARKGQHPHGTGGTIGSSSRDTGGRDGDREVEARDRDRRTKLVLQLAPLTDALLMQENGEATWRWTKSVAKIIHDERIDEDKEGSYQLIISRLSGDQVAYQRWSALLASQDVQRSWRSLRQWLLRTFGPMATRTFKQCVTELNTMEMLTDTTVELVRVHLRIQEINDRLTPPFPDHFLCKFLLQALHPGLRDKLDKTFLDTPTFADLTRMLEAKQTERMKMFETHHSNSTVTTSLALTSSADEAQPLRCYNCKQAGHKSRECPVPLQPPRTACSSCGQQGHLAVQCRGALAPAYRPDHRDARDRDYDRRDHHDRSRSDYHRRDSRRDSSRSDRYDRSSGSREYARSSYRGQRPVLLAPHDMEDRRHGARQGETGDGTAALQANAAGPNAAPPSTA
jgi:hypothetical protein